MSMAVTTSAIWVLPSPPSASTLAVAAVIAGKGVVRQPIEINSG